MVQAYLHPHLCGRGDHFRFSVGGKLRLPRAKPLSQGPQLGSKEQSQTCSSPDGQMASYKPRAWPRTDFSLEKKNPNGQCQQVLLSLRKPMNSDRSPAVLPGTHANSAPSTSLRMGRKDRGESLQGEALAPPLHFTGLPWWLRRWRSRLQHQRLGFNPSVGKIPWIELLEGGSNWPSWCPCTYLCLWYLEPAQKLLAE